MRSASLSALDHARYDDDDEDDDDVGGESGQNGRRHRASSSGTGTGTPVVGAYSPRSRRMRIERFLEKRQHRIWRKSIKYDVRKSFADSRLRVRGRFVKKEDEEVLKEAMSLV